MTIKYPRGSEWRRWDLHVHSPESALGNNFTTWEEYLKKIEGFGNTVSVIGVTDYASIDGYKILRHEKESNGRIPEIIELLPNIEFRITPPTQQGKGINIHIIVDPKDNNHIEQIEGALSRLTFEYDDQPYPCTKDGLTGLGGRIIGASESQASRYYEGVNQFKPSIDVISEWYKKEGWLRSNSLIVLANGSNDGASGIQHDDGLRATREKIYRLSDIIFSARPKDIKYFLGQDVDDRDTVIERYGSIKPCIHGSDAHDNEKIFLPDLNRFCWIKSDPTFEGLRQIVYEPEARVRIQEINPVSDFKKPFFSSLKVLGATMIDGSPIFSGDEISLNPGMVTLIGGRGTGKSILLDCVFKLFNSDILTTEKRLIKIQPDNLEMDYTKSDSEIISYKYGEDANLDYLHVRQGDIKNIADDPQKLSDHIKELLGINSSDETPEYDFEISSIIKRIESTLAWFDLEDTDRIKINDKARNEKIIQINHSLIKTITTDENKDNIEKYQKNSQEINNRRTSINRLSELKSKLTTYKIEIEREVAEINELQLDDDRLSLVDFSPLINSIGTITETLEGKINEFIANNVAIEKLFKEQGIDQDVGGLLKKLEIYQKEIDLAEKRLTEYEAKESAVQMDVVVRTGLVQKIKDDLTSQLGIIESSYQEVTSGKDSWSDDQKGLVEKLLRDIKIDGAITFDRTAFYRGLLNLLNGQKFRSTNTETQADRVQSKLNVDSYESYIRLISDERVIDNGDGGLITLNEFSIQDEYFLKNNYDIYEYLYLHRYRKNYLFVKPLIQYLDKPPEKLSVGQRGTFYVCMKLATDPFGSPFIFDQPEDDLDNKFIMKELVPIFRAIKNYRQVIIATHNANLVVNTDAEQIVIASNNEESLSYESGSIEDAGTRENLCDILEGGQIAFESREKKYGFDH